MAISFDLVSLLIGSAIGAGSIGIAYLIAKRSGAFRKVRFNISLMDRSLFPAPEFSEVAFGCPVDDNALVICYLPFRISNHGQLSARNVTIRFAYPSGIRPFRHDILQDMELFGPLYKSDIRRQAFELEGRKIVDYLIPVIHPGKESGVLIEEGIDINFQSALSAPFVFGATTKDRIPLQVTARLNLLARIDVRVAAEDVAPLECHFGIRCYRVEDERELAEKIAQDETETFRENLRQQFYSRIKVPQDKRKDVEQFISKAYPRDISKAMILVMPKLIKVPMSKEEYSTIKRPLYAEEVKRSVRWLIAPNGRAEPVTVSRGPTTTH
jgi:hypothetical protein